MNKIYLILFLFSLTFTSFAQKTDKFSAILEKQILEADTNIEFTVWIYFTDKGDNIDQKLATAEQAINPLSLERRKRSLKNKALITTYDIPVLNSYIETVSPFITKIRHQSKWLNAISANLDKASLQDIAALDFVKSIDIVRKGKRNMSGESISEDSPCDITKSTDVLYDLDYGPSLTQLEQINVPIVHDLGYTGNGMIICVLDAGFREVDTHPALMDINVMATYDFVNDDTNVDDQVNDMGSGTHGRATLSTIGGFEEGELIGPAYGAAYLLAKTENTESETMVEEDNWVAAAEWAEGLGADITSTSLGYLGFDDGSGYTPDELDGNTSIITIAGDVMASMGVLVVNSAGNSGGGTTTIGAPADGNEILAIGAVTATGMKSGFSSVGPTADGRIKPDVMAMGSSVVVASGNGNFGTSNGTSFSCPLVAGAAALLWEMVPSATNMEIFEALKMSADNAANPNNDYGWGIINLYAAFEYLSSPDTEAPVAACQDVTVTLAMDGAVDVTADAVDAGSTDDTGIASYSLSSSAFTCDDLGDVVVTLTVEDPAGNSGTCLSTITVLDNLSPVPDVANLPMILAACEVISLPEPTVGDNCDGIINVGVSHDANLPINAQGTTIVNWTYIDGSGNTSTQIQEIVIEDNVVPVVMTQNITIDLDGAASISIVPAEVDAGSSDNCGVATLSLDLSSFTDIGEYPVVLTAEDVNGNISTGNATVTIINSVVGVNNLSFSEEFKLYPNPADDVVFVEVLDGVDLEMSIRVYSVAGELVKEVADYRSLDRIALDEIGNGLYIVKVERGGEIWFVKLVLAR